ncbi:MAG: preprotein translocase subunit YajC [Planctomycetes bacterium]|nr:preprotein translocase subunit YajC [Planctomycetota bacterium]
MALFGAIMVVFYLLLIRPQQRKQKDAERRKKEMLGSLKKNDHVLTIGGIHGVVTNVGEDEVAVRVDDKTGACVRISRDAISRVVGDEGEDEEKASGETK